MRTFALAGIALLTTASLGVAQAPPTDPFPHEDHEGLFPLCTGCHEAASGVDALRPLYPDAASCVGCHDGDSLSTVAWSEPTPTATHLIYDHASHRSEIASAGDEQPACASCHANPDTTRWAVERVVSDGCWTCHETTDHTSEGACLSCHVPVAQTDLSAEAVSGWDAPADHSGPEYLATEHGEAAVQPTSAGSCVTCHTRDQCLSCHVDPAEPTVASIDAAPPSLAHLLIDPAYPVPASHEVPNWGETHGPSASSRSCTTCHTRDDCATCHIQSPPQEVQELISRDATVAPGAELTRVAPATHQPRDFAESHGLLASSSNACATCHLAAECSQCHLGAAVDPQPTTAPVLASASPASGRPSALHPLDTPRRTSQATEPASTEAAGPSGGFHASNYVLQHSTEAWNGLLECSNCHETQLFCRSCHSETGVTAEGRLGQGYHDAQPLWLLRHGQAARQALESCAGCHQQRQCLQCHSSTGAFRVSPHRSGFDADDAAEKAGRMCYACHLGGPPGTGGAP